MRTLWAAVAAACFAACIPPPKWVPTEETFTAPKAGFSVVLPAGWARLHWEKKADQLLLSRDGTALERIQVTSDEPGNRFIVGDSKRVFRPEMSPQEAAEAVVDGLQSVSGWSGLQVIENGPATLAGRKGFKVAARYKDGDGLRKGIAVYGVLTPDGVYYLLFQAPERVYFARHLPEFERLVASFQLRPDAKGVKWERDEEEEGAEPKKPEEKQPPEAPKDAPAPSAYAG